MRLVDLDVGATATVARIAGDGRMALRIMELGLFPGVEVHVLGRSFGNLRLAAGPTRLAIAEELAGVVVVTEHPDDAASSIAARVAGGVA